MVFFAVGIQSAKIKPPRFSLSFFTVMYLIVVRENKTPRFEKRLKPRKKDNREKTHFTVIKYKHNMSL